MDRTENGLKVDTGVEQMLQLNAAFESKFETETLGAFVARRARDMGDATLGVWFDDDQRLSFQALDRDADKLASSFVRIGVRKGTHLAVMLPSLPAFLLTWVALARIGAVMVTVNTAYKRDEIEHVLTDSDSQFFVFDESFSEVCGGIDACSPLLTADRLIVHGAAHADNRSWRHLMDSGVLPFEPPAQVVPNDLLSIQYTSGTTGLPKGCMLTHEYWMMFAQYAAHFRGDNGNGKISNILVWAPMYYVDGQWMLLMSMQLGATAYIPQRMQLSRFFDWLEQYDIHHCVFPEPALKQREPSSADKALSLKFISVYGWRADARAQVQERFNVIAREGYGMTETGGSTIMPSAAADMALTRSCGLAGPFRELRIVNTNGEDVAPGETGELWVAGRSLFWGYYKRPDANAESFRGRWFRTGDLFRQDERGYYYLVGRVKDMIKRAGENIAAQEVEAVLRELPQVEEAAVVAVPDPDRREEVKAYIMLAAGFKQADLSPDQIFEHCSAKLANFKVPRYISYASDFPRTASRKIAKTRLTQGVSDLRSDAYDRVEQRWHSSS